MRSCTSTATLLNALFLRIRVAATGRPYPYTGVGSMGNKPYVLDGLLSWLSRLGSKSVQTMILLENFLRLESTRGRRYLYSPSCREQLFPERPLTHEGIRLI